MGDHSQQTVSQVGEDLSCPKEELKLDTVDEDGKRCILEVSGVQGVLLGFGRG